MNFDENCVVEYQRSYLYTEDGKKTIEEFYTNSPKNNEKIWQKEKSPFDKILNSLGIETEPTLSDIDMEAMRAQADELTAKYVAEFGEEEELKAESFAIIEAQIEAAKAAVSKSIEDLPFKIS